MEPGSAEITTDTTISGRSYHQVGRPVHYWVDDIQCNGDELSLLNCTHAPPGVHDCDSNERAGVACEF